MLGWPECVGVAGERPCDPALRVAVPGAVVAAPVPGQAASRGCRALGNHAGSVRRPRATSGAAAVGSAGVRSTVL